MYSRELSAECEYDSPVTPSTQPLQAFKHRMGLAPEASTRRSHFGGLGNMSGLAQRLKTSVEKAAHQASTSMHQQPKASKARASGDASHAFPPGDASHAFPPGNPTTIGSRTSAPAAPEQAGVSRDAANANAQQGGRGRLQGLMGDISRSARQAKSAAAESLERARQQR